MTKSSDSDAAPEYEKVGEYVSMFIRKKNWYANFQVQGKQVRKSLRTKSKKEARRRALIIERDISTGDFQQSRQAPCLAEVIAQYIQYLETEGRASKTIDKYNYCFELVKDLASRRRTTLISGINIQFVDAFRRERVKNKAKPKTVHTDTVIVKQLVNFSLKRGMLQEDPLKGLEIKRPKRTPQPFWTREQMDLILANSNPPHLEAFILLSGTGMRIGELKNLTWSDIDFDEARPIIRIRPKAGWKPKSGDERIIPMSPTVAETLKRLPHRGQWILTATESVSHPKPGRQISERRLLEYLKRVLKQLKLPGHVHTFRHSFISHCLTQGTPEAIVRAWVGHVDAEVLRWYTHIADQMSHNWMQRLGASQTSSTNQLVEKPGKTSAQIQHKHRNRKNAKSAK